MTRIRPLWLWLIIGIILVILTVITQIKTDEVHSKAMIPKSTDKISLYVPSPYEMKMIESEKDIWPRRFGPQQPPEASDLPVIYSAFMTKHPLQREEIDFFRTLAMTAALGEWNAFKEALDFKVNIRIDDLTPNKVLQWVKNEKCSNYGQEIAYRLVQWEPTKLDAVKDIYIACDPHSFHALWFDILSTLNRNDKKEIAALSQKIQKRRELLPNESFEYFLLTQTFDSLDMKLAHGR